MRKVRRPLAGLLLLWASLHLAWMPIGIPPSAAAPAVARPPLSGTNDGQADEPASSDVLTPEIVVGLRRVTAAALDPSGRQVAYSLSVPRDPEEKPGRPHSEIWLARVDGGEPRRFTAPRGTASAPAWSPDGTRITFLAGRPDQAEHTQIYAIPVDGGEAVPLTRHPISVQAYRWSPDGGYVAFVATDPETEEERKAREEGRDWIVVGEEMQHRRLWILDVQSGDTRKLYEADLSTWEFAWTPDGGSLVIQATDSPRIDASFMFRSLYRVPAAGGEPVEVCCPIEGKLGHMAVSPQGDRLAYLGATSLNDPLPQSLFVLPLEGGDSVNLTPGRAASATWVDWVDEETLLLLETVGTHTVLSRVDAGSGRRTPVLESGPIFQALDLDRDSGAFAAVAHTPQHPAETYLGSVAERSAVDLVRLSHSNPVLDGIRLARQRTVEWQAADGWRIEGVLTYPLDHRPGSGNSAAPTGSAATGAAAAASSQAAPRHPLVLQIHGGPEGVDLDGWTTSALYPVQLLAAAGYAVLQPNYRGSGGRGVEFSKADHDDLGGREFEDILAGIDALAARGLVDPQRVGTGGWSYGGYFSAWAATRHSERFRAAVVAAGIANWISFTGTTDIPYEMSLVHWNQWWFDQPELHWRRSPLAHLESTDTPVLVVHGMADERVHPAQALELYTALRIKGVPTELVLYPRQPHGLLERAHQLDFARRVLDWFRTHVMHAER